MTLKELEEFAKPIKFREDMERSVEFGRKTATRRLLKNQDSNAYCAAPCEDEEGSVDLICEGADGVTYALYNKAKYKVGDILYIKEQCRKEAEKIFLLVTGVRVQRVEEITEDEAIDEGFASRAEFLVAFFEIYPKADMRSWVWAIEFQRLEVDVDDI